MTMPAAGDQAPDVALPDESGTVHRLSDQRGRWTILYFYPKDDTPGCTIEACEFRDSNETIRERGADVWGVSPQGAASKRAFREKFGLPFTLLADEEHTVAERYGSWVEKQNYGKTYWGTARTTFLVDPEGRIARVWPKVKADGHAAEVLAALDEEQAARAGSGAAPSRA
jgi:peroxiredoxin Q/BCP